MTPLEEGARGVEDEVTFDGTEAGGKIGGAGGSIFYVYFPGDARAVESAFEGGVDLSSAAGVEVWNKTGQETHIERAVEFQVDGRGGR